MTTVTSEPVRNLALQWLLDNDLCAGEIDCVELAGEVAGDDGRIAWLESMVNGKSLRPAWGHGCVFWAHHAIAVVDGIAHDVFGPGPRPLDQWVAEAFPDQDVKVEFPAEWDNLDATEIAIVVEDQA